MVNDLFIVCLLFNTVSAQIPENINIPIRDKMYDLLYVSVVPV